MVEFEVIDITAKRSGFTVEVELKESRERRMFGFPMNEGWETLIDGELKYIRQIKSLLGKDETAMSIKDFEKFKKETVGKTFGFGGE